MLQSFDLIIILSDNYFNNPLFSNLYLLKFLEILQQNRSFRTELFNGSSHPIFFFFYINLEFFLLNIHIKHVK